MPPAFFSNRQATGFICLLAVLVLSPVLLRLTGPPSRAAAYQAVPLEAGDYAALQRAIFEDRSALDIAFVGTSPLASAIDAPAVQHELSRALGREARVLLLATNGEGIDLQYILLRDLLERRKVRMVVMSMPAPGFTFDRPHPQAFRWLRFGDFPDTLAQLPSRSQFALYAGYVLSAPRQWLTLLRADRTSPAPAAELMEAYYPAQTPTIAPEEMIYSPATAARFDFDGPMLGPYQLHFARAIAGPLGRAGSSLTLLHVPLEGERGAGTVAERMFWPRVVPLPLSIAGIPASILFRGTTRQQYDHYFHRRQLTTSGKALFTRAITPALIRIYEEHTH